MWTLDELIEMRDRAELEVGGNEQNLLWRQACVSLAISTEYLVSLTTRIDAGKMTALSDNNGMVKLLPSTEE